MPPYRAWRLLAVNMNHFFLSIHTHFPKKYESAP